MKFHPITQNFINAIGNNQNITEIIAYFRNGKTGTYTMNIFELLKSDPDVTNIIDATTGELLYFKK